MYQLIYLNLGRELSSVGELSHLNRKKNLKSASMILLKKLFPVLYRVIGILVSLKTMHCYCFKKLTEWQWGY